jgi:hypothetical protein
MMNVIEIANMAYAYSIAALAMASDAQSACMHKIVRLWPSIVELQM